MQNGGGAAMNDAGHWVLQQGVSANFQLARAPAGMWVVEPRLEQAAEINTGRIYSALP